MTTRLTICICMILILAVINFKVHHELRLIREVSIELMHERDSCRE